MTVKTFFYGISLSFGIPWLLMLAIPYLEMRQIDVVKYDEIEDGRTDNFQGMNHGLVSQGSQIYGQQGCALCHTQLTRPTYAGNDVFRTFGGGVKNDANRGDTRRESVIQDYVGEEFAWIGEMRIGGDLGNFGRKVDFLAQQYNEKLAKEREIELRKLPAEDRFDAEQYVLEHLYNPRNQDDMEWSVCPSNKSLFKKIPNFGQGHFRRVDLVSCGDTEYQVVPDDAAIELASYLLSLRRDSQLPYKINPDRNKVKDSDK